MISENWYMRLAIWYLISDTWYTILDIWYLILDNYNLISYTWYLKLAITCKKIVPFRSCSATRSCLFVFSFDQLDPLNHFHSETDWILWLCIRILMSIAENGPDNPSQLSAPSPCRPCPRTLPNLNGICTCTFFVSTKLISVL